MMGSTDQSNLTDGQTELSKPLWHLKKMRLFFFLFPPNREMGFIPSARISSKGLFLSIKNILFSDPVAEIKRGSVMYKN